MKHTLIDICLTLKLRDFAAFEDLAHELGYQLTIKHLAPTESPPPRRSSTTRNRVTPELVAAVKNYAKLYPNATHRKLRDLIQSKTKLKTSPASVGKILQGQYDEVH